jgi:2-dehydropantoate 2-reductase
MRVLVFGAGAIGSLLGAYLAKAGWAVHLVAREAHVRAIHAHGLRVTGIWGDFAVRNLEAVTQCSALAANSYDVVLITVKAYDTRAAAQAVQPYVGPTTCVCAVQNGLGNSETLQERFSKEQIALGRIITGVEHEPGQVRVTVCGGDLLLGCLASPGPQAVVQALVAAWDLAGLKAQLHPDIQVAVWGKVLYNCALNGLAAVMGVPYGALLNNPLARAIMRKVVDEAYAVAGAEGITLYPQQPGSYWKLLCAELIPATAQHYPSMYRDLLRQRPTEIDALNGAIGRLAAKHGMPVPQNTLITRLVKEQERFHGITPRTSGE